MAGPRPRPLLYSLPSGTIPTVFVQSCQRQTTRLISLAIIDTVSQWRIVGKPFFFYDRPLKDSHCK